MSEHSSPIAFTGSCACKNITYTSTTLPASLANCYCVTCRKLSGAPFTTFAETPTSSLTWIVKNPSSFKQTSYSDIATRQHCGDCGTPISMQYKCEMEVIGLTVSSIDEESVRGKIPDVGMHIFVEQVVRIGGFEVPKDDIPRAGRLTKGFQRTIEAWKKGLAGPGLG